MARWRQRKIRRYGGQGVVELALLTPLLILILVGALDLGRVYIYATRVNNAIKEGALTGLYQNNIISVKKRAFRESTDPGISADTSDDRYLLGQPDSEFIIDTLNLYQASAPTTKIDCSSTTPPVTCTRPGPGDVIEVSGYYIFQPDYDADRTNSSSELQDSPDGEGGVLMRIVHLACRVRRAEGQTLVLFALMSLALLAGLGLVIDAGVNYAERRNMQNAADTAALVGARIIARQAADEVRAGRETIDRDDVWSAVFTTAVANGAPNDESRYTCDFIDNARNALDQPCKAAANTAIPAYATGVRVRVSETHTTFFMRAVGIQTSSTAATSTAQVQVMVQQYEWDVVFAVCGIYSPGGADTSILVGREVEDSGAPRPNPTITPTPTPVMMTVVRDDTAVIRSGAYAYDWNRRNPDGSFIPINTPAPDFVISAPTMPEAARCGLTGTYDHDWHGLIAPADARQEVSQQTVATNGEVGAGAAAYDVDRFQPIIGTRAGVPNTSTGPVHTINGTQGCVAGQNPNDCVMVLPIVVPEDPSAYRDNNGGKSRGDLIGRLWGAFYITKSGNEYRGKLIKNYPIHANGNNVWSLTYPAPARPYTGPLVVNLVK